MQTIVKAFVIYLVVVGLASVGSSTNFYQPTQGNNQEVSS